jgi:hypothetical protein
MGVSDRSGTSNRSLHCCTVCRIFGANPPPFTGRAGVFRSVPNCIPFRLNRSMTSFFSASAAGFSLSLISSASIRLRVRVKGSAI